jgi:hypothetical protein
MQTFQIVRINPVVESVTQKKPQYDPSTGQVVGEQEVAKKFQVAYATDGTRFEGVLTEFPFAMPPGYVDVGDVVSGYVNGSGQLVNVTIERGRNAIAKPAPATPAPKPEPLPSVQSPQVEPWRFAVASGYAATPTDIAAFAQAFFALEGAFKKHLAEHGEKFS